MTSASSRPHKVSSDKQLQTSAFNDLAAPLPCTQSSRKLDSRLSVARFKLHPLPANTSLVIQS